MLMRPRRDWTPAKTEVVAALSRLRVGRRLRVPASSIAVARQTVYWLNRRGKRSFTTKIAGDHMHIWRLR